MTVISDTSVSTLVDNLDGTYTYTDETGNPSTIDTRAASNPYDNTVSGLAATDVQAAIDEINAAAGTVALVDNLDGTYSFTDAGGNVTVISDTSVSTLVDNLDGTYTYTDETGNPSTIDTRAASNPYDNTVSGLAATDVQAAIDEINAAAGTVALVDNLDGTYSFTDAGGNVTVISDTSVSTLVDNLDGTYTYTDEAGNPSTIDTRAASNPYDNTVSGLAATDVQAAIDEINAAAGTVALVDNLDGTYSFTDAGGNVTVISDTSVSTLVDNLDGTYTYTDETGNPSTIDTRAASNPYDNTVSGLAATNVQDAIDELNTGSTDDQNINGSGLSGTDLTIGIENGSSEIVDLSSLSETVVAGTGAITVTDDGNGNYTVNSTDPDEDLTNELTLIGTGAPAIVPSNSGVTYVDDAAGQLYVYDGAAWQVVGGNASPDLDPDPANEVNTAFAVNGLNLEITDSAGTLAVPLASIGSDDQDLTGASLTGNILQIDIENGGSTTVDLSALDNTGTDDQNISGSGLSGTDLTIGIENGGSEVVDLSSLVGTDDQTAAEVSYDNTTSLLTATDTQAALDELAAASSDDQNLTLAGNTLSIEDGNNVDLSGYLDNTDDQNLTGATLTGNTLQIDIENGTSASVDLSALDNSGTDDQNLTLAGNTLSIEDGNSVDLSGYVSTDDQNISGSGLSGTDLTIGIENGGSEVVDLSSLANTDEQDLSSAVITPNESVEIQITNGSNTTIDIRDADSDVTNELTLIGSGAPAVIPSNSGVTYVDDVAGQLYVYDGSAWNAVGGNASPDLDGDPTNEQNTAFAINGANLEITDSGGTLGVPLAALGTDDQNLTLAGNTLSIEDGNNVDLSGYLDNTDDQNLTAATLTGNTLQIDIENGSSASVDLSALDNSGTDDQNLTLAGNTLSIEDGNSVDLSGYVSTDDQNLTLAGNTLSIEDGNNVDLSGYLDNTDDQNLTGATLTGNTLQIDIENGTSASVDLSALDNSGTDDQALSLAGNTLTLEDGGSVDLSGYVSTDDQALSLAGNTLTLEDGGSVDLSGYVSTDDQNLTLAGNTLSIEDGNNVDLSGYLDNTDDQNLTGATLTGNTLQIDIENGTSASVDLSSLDNSGTDDQALSLAGNTLTLEDGGSVDLSGYVSTDDQNIQNLGLAGTTLTVGIESGTSQTVDLASLVGTDDQALSLAGNTLTLEDGGSVDLSGYVSTDDQNLTLAGNTLSIEDGNNVDLSGYLDNTDDQNLTGATLTGNTLQIDIENGASATVDLSSLVGTDNQTISSNNTPGDITISGGNNITLNVDDADAIIGNEVTDATDATLIRSGLGTTVSPYTLDVAPDGITNAELADNAVQLENLADGTSDGQVMQWDGATSTWTLVDLGSVTVTENDGVIGNEVTNATDGTLVRSGAGTTVSPYTLDVAANGITNAEIADDAVQLENIANGTAPDQIMQWNGTNWILVDGGALSTDDQNLTLAGNTLSIEDGNSVDLSGYLDNTDDQNLTGATLTGNTLQIDIENGSSASVDLSSIDTDTDDQTLSLAGNTLSIADGNSVDLSGYVSSDDQNLTGATLTGNTLQIDIENGSSASVDLSSIDTDTDDQTLSLAGNTLSIADGNSVDLSGYVSTDDQNIQNLGLVGTTLTVGIESGTSQTVDLASLVGTDDQALSLAGNTLTLEDGGSVDLSGYVSTDDQNLTLAGNTLSIEDGNNVDLSGYLDNTDDQNLTAATLTGNTLQIDIENGSSASVDLRPLTTVVRTTKT